MILMSESWLSWDGKDAGDLPGVGRYGKDSYDIFVRGIPKGHEDVLDKELKNYLKWLDSQPPEGGPATYPHGEGAAKAEQARASQAEVQEGEGRSVAVPL